MNVNPLKVYRAFRWALRVARVLQDEKVVRIKELPDVERVVEAIERVVRPPRPAPPAR